VRRHGLKLIIENDMELQSCVVSGRIVNQYYITTVDKRMANIDAKPSTRVPLRSGMVSILKAFVQNIHGAAPRMQVMKVQRLWHVGEFFYGSNCCAVMTIITIDIDVDGMANSEGPKELVNGLRPSFLSMKKHG